MKKRIRRGFTFRNPNGDLDYRIVHSVAAAQSNAAFDSERPYSYIELPTDWDRAYNQGFRIVPATLTSGPSDRAWKRHHDQQ